MKIKFMLLALISSIFLLMSSPSFAHHGYSRFDGSRPLYLSGVIQKIYWGQPHVEITVRTEGRTPPPSLAKQPIPEGGVIPKNLRIAAKGDWKIVISTIIKLERRGLKAADVAVGKRIMMVAYPSCDDRNGGRAELLWVDGGKNYWVRDAAAQTMCKAP